MAILLKTKREFRITAASIKVGSRYSAALAIVGPWDNLSTTVREFDVPIPETLLESEREALDAALAHADWLLDE